MGFKQGGIVGLVAIAAVALAACEGVGDGSAPDPKTAVIAKNGGTAALGDTKLFTCVAQQMQYSIAFSNDGGREDFTSRARWSSSNKDVAIVTNIGDPVEPEELDPATGKKLVYTVSGLVLPRAPGTVRISANAFGITEFIDPVTNPEKIYTVVDPAAGSLRVEALAYGNENATAIKMNHNTTQQLRLVGILDGFKTDLTSSLKSLSFEGSNDGAVANFTVINDVPTTIVQSVKDTTKTGTRIARPKFIACDSLNTIVKDVKMDVTVAAATGLAIKREFDAPVNGNVLAVNTGTTAPISTTELMQIYATFDGNSNLAQNLSNQILATSSKPELIVPLAFSSRSGVTALSTGTGTTPPPVSEDVTISYCQPEPLPDPVPSNYTSKCWEGKPTTTSIVFKTRQSTLASFDVSPTVDVVIPALQSLQFRALGSFDGGFQQDITRHVTWQSFAADGTTRSTKVGIGTGTGSAGLAISVSLKNTDGDPTHTPAQELAERTVVIKATNNNATGTKEKTVTATISQ